jgi:HPt (histidine-containing phosphotransfer) domain-containing protein
LALPVVRRSELVGFLAVGEKTDRTLYRPDEIEDLVRTVHQVSSDLYALQLERFQQRSQELEQQNEALRDELRSFAGASASLQNFVRYLKGITTETD